MTTKRQPPAGASAAQTVIDMPAEIDGGNAEQVGEALAAAMRPGLNVVIADLTATTFCDLRGARVFAMARRQAVQNGTALRLVVPSRAVRLAFEITELDRRVPIYASLSAALAPEMGAASPAAAASPGSSGSSRPGATSEGSRGSPGPHRRRRIVPRKILSQGWRLRLRGATRA